MVLVLDSSVGRALAWKAKGPGSSPGGGQNFSLSHSKDSKWQCQWYREGSMFICNHMKLKTQSLESISCICTADVGADKVVNPFQIFDTYYFSMPIPQLSIWRHRDSNSRSSVMTDEQSNRSYTEAVNVQRKLRLSLTLNYEKLYSSLNILYIKIFVDPGGPVVIIPASGSEVRGCDPCRDRWILSERKNPSEGK